VQTQPDNTTRLGGWLFRHRTSLPLPVAIAILAVPAGDAWRSPLIVGGGVVVTLLGELIRFWGVHHIGVISRTRSERLGPLIESGPFALVRNPLYIGNILLWVGFALTARLVWLAPIVLVLLGAEYHAIVRWEETLLESRLGEAYVDYTARVNRWLPLRHKGHKGDEGHKGNDPSAISASSAVKQTNVKPYSWSETLFSERGTLLAIAAGYLLLWIKAQL
jgi:protein-S-isoprenylcysteine O-methyltransferase Ste14